MKIRTAIFSIYVVASAVGFVGLMLFVLAEVRPRYVAALRGNLQDTVRVLAPALQGRTKTEAAAALGGKESFHVRLMAADGRVIFDSMEGLTPAGDDLEVSAEASLHLADESNAHLVVSRSLRGVNAIIWAERQKLAGISLLIAGVMLVAGWWISARLTHSLERLTLYAQGIRDGLSVTPPQSQATEIAALAQAFEEMRDALAGRKHAERYTQALAHEVKAPIAAIRGAAELLGEDMPEPQREKFLGNIRSEAARIQQIVDRLLELSSLEARKALHQTEPIDLDELMDEAAAILRPAYESARVTLTVTGLAVTVRGERVLLREALVNLLQNALDFSPAGGAVGFAANAERERTVVAVEDRGPGVPAYAMARVFERFYSLPRPGTTRKSTGWVWRWCARLLIFTAEEPIWRTARKGARERRFGCPRRGRRCCPRCRRPRFPDDFITASHGLHTPRSGSRGEPTTCH